MIVYSNRVHALLKSKKNSVLQTISSRKIARNVKFYNKKLLQFFFFLRHGNVGVFFEALGVLPNVTRQ